MARPQLLLGLLSELWPEEQNTHEQISENPGAQGWG
jgi:hypothetical protein